MVRSNVRITRYPFDQKYHQWVYPPQCTGIYSSNLKIHKLRVYGSSFVACVFVLFCCVFVLFRRLFFVPTFAVVWKSKNI